MKIFQILISNYLKFMSNVLTGQRKGPPVNSNTLARLQIHMTFHTFFGIHMIGFMKPRLRRDAIRRDGYGR